MTLRISVQNPPAPRSFHLCMRGIAIPDQFCMRCERERMQRGVTTVRMEQIPQDSAEMQAGDTQGRARTAAEAVKCVDERAARVIKAPIVLR